MNEITFKMRMNNLTAKEATGEAVKIKGFNIPFALTFEDNQYSVNETSYGIRIAKDTTKEGAIKEAKRLLKAWNITNSDSLVSCAKYTLKSRVKEYMRAKYRPELEQAYSKKIIHLFHPLFGFDVIKFAEVYYPAHATNNESLKDMIARDKGQRIALIVKAIL